MHRDVKPGNLLRDRDGVVKLADFGIAKAAEQSDITKVGSVLGTAAYLSPEQARGEPAGPASDLYALGVVAYQLLAGRLPVRGGSLTDLARLQETGPPPRLDEITATCRRRWPSAVARRARAATRADRYADAAEMEEALRDGLRGIAPAPPSATRAAADTAATRMLGHRHDPALPRAAQSAPRRRLRADRRAAAATPRSGPPRSPRLRRARRRAARAAGCSRCLLVVLALVAAGVVAYTALNSSNGKSVQLGRTSRGRSTTPSISCSRLIEDNTQ